MQPAMAKVGTDTASLVIIPCSNIPFRPMKICPIDCEQNQDWYVSVDHHGSDDELGTLVISRGTEEEAVRKEEDIPSGYTRSIIGSFNTGDNNRIALGDPCALYDDCSDVYDNALYTMKNIKSVEGVYFSTNHSDGFYHVVCLFESKEAQLANKPMSARVIFTQPCHNALCDALGMP